MSSPPTLRYGGQVGGTSPPSLESLPLYSTLAALAGLFVNKMHKELSEDSEFRRNRLQGNAPGASASRKENLSSADYQPILAPCMLPKFPYWARSLSVSFI